MWVRRLAAALVAAAVAFPVAATAAPTEKRLATLERKLARLTKAVRELQDVNAGLRTRIVGLEKRSSALEKRLAAEELKSSHVTATAIDASRPLAPSALYPDDFTTVIGVPEDASPFVGHLWLTVSVTYGQMSGGFLHYAVEPETGGGTGARCDGFSPAVWGSGVHTFSAYCAVDLPPGSGIRITAGSFDEGSGTSTAASVKVTGTLLEMKRP